MNLSIEREYYLKLKTELEAFKAYAKENFAVILTVAYLLSSSAGILYLHALMSSFNVNIFYHIELSDYLLALMTNATIISAFLTFAFFVFVMITFRIKFLPKPRKDTWLNRFYLRLARPFYRLPPLFSLIFTAYIVLLSYAALIGGTHAEQVLESKSDFYNVTLNYPVDIGGEKVLQFPRIKLVTSTNSNLFVYDLDKQLILILPIANIAGMSPLPPVRMADGD